MLSKTRISKAWRNPEWCFHRENSYWYALDVSAECICIQDAVIQVGDDGLGYDCAIDGSYTVKIRVAERGGASAAEFEKSFAGMRSHRELKRTAVDWIYETLAAL